MAQERMLGRAQADGGSGRVAGADLEIDIAESRVEGRRIGVADLVAIGDGGDNGDRHLVGDIERAAREDDHVGDASLETGRAVAQHQDRPGRAEAEDADGNGHQQGAGDAVAARGQKDDAAVARIGGAVDGGLERGGVVGLAVASGVGDDGVGIVRLGQENRWAGKGCDGNAAEGGGQQRHRGCRCESSAAMTVFHVLYPCSLIFR